MSDTQMKAPFEAVHVPRIGSFVVYHGLVAVLTILSVFGIAAARLAGRRRTASGIFSEARACARASAGYAVRY